MQQAILREHRVKDNHVTLSCDSPFYLLPYPLPVPYTMTYALKQENPLLDYKKYILGGLFGELFVSFIYEYYLIVIDFYV